MCCQRSPTWFTLDCRDTFLAYVVKWQNDSTAYTYEPFGLRVSIQAVYNFEDQRAGCILKR